MLAKNQSPTISCSVAGVLQMAQLLPPPSPKIKEWWAARVADLEDLQQDSSLLTSGRSSSGIPEIQAFACLSCLLPLLTGLSVLFSNWVSNNDNWQLLPPASPLRAAVSQEPSCTTSNTLLLVNLGFLPTLSGRAEGLQLSLALTDQY